MAALFAPCLACSRTETTNVEAKLVQPQRDQLVFFERPKAIAAARKSDLPSPVVVLLENDPWAMVIGSGSPAFALYEDGTIIHKTGNGFRAARITKNEIERLVERLNFNALSRSYGLLDADEATTDQPIVAGNLHLSQCMALLKILRFVLNYRRKSSQLSTP